MAFSPTTFSQALLDWYDTNGRKHLPWQSPKTPYGVWLSEVMLQQTQVSTVIPYFIRFMEAFPTVEQLAQASDDEVLAMWSGLGYYSRCRNLHKSAQLITNQYHGQIPQSLEELIKLPGIGRSTAAAILSQAFDLPTAILDGNVKRVLSRYFLVSGQLNLSTTLKQLWSLAQDCMPVTRCGDYTQAIMDFGATCCTSKSPGCHVCPIRQECQARQHNLVSLYPAKTIKSTLPIKHRQFLLLYDDHNRVYLEKNKPDGLWGGLWCTPSISVEVDAKRHVEEAYALTVETPQLALTIKHTFSHFKLHIKALFIKSTALPAETIEHPGLWFSLQETSKLGLAKPIRDILNAFYLSL